MWLCKVFQSSVHQNGVTAQSSLTLDELEEAVELFDAV